MTRGAVHVPGARAARRTLDALERGAQRAAPLPVAERALAALRAALPAGLVAPADPSRALGVALDGELPATEAEPRTTARRALALAHCRGAAVAPPCPARASSARSTPPPPAPTADAARARSTLPSPGAAPTPAVFAGAAAPHRSAAHATSAHGTPHPPASTADATRHGSALLAAAWPRTDARTDTAPARSRARHPLPPPAPPDTAPAAAAPAAIAAGHMHLRVDVAPDAAHADRGARSAPARSRARHPLPPSAPPDTAPAAAAPAAIAAGHMHLRVDVAPDAAHADRGARSAPLAAAPPASALRTPALVPAARSAPPRRLSTPPSAPPPRAAPAPTDTEAPGDAPSPRGLAGLARWWRDHGSDAAPRAPADATLLAQPAAPPALELPRTDRCIDDDAPPFTAASVPALGRIDELEAALEHVLVRELRRHGVVQEEP